MTYEIGDTTLVAVASRAHGFDHFVAVFRYDDRGLTLIGDLENEALVEEGHLLETARKRGEVVMRGLEYVGVGPEGNGRAGLGCRLALVEGRDRDAVSVLLPVHEPIAPDFNIESIRQRVDN